MQKGKSNEQLIEEIKGLPEPWCNFSIDKKASYEIITEEDYNKHLPPIRDLIYNIYDEASITMGKLPQIISPMFWEAYQGFPREKIYSLKNPGEIIKESTFNRIQRRLSTWSYLKKVQIVNLNIYKSTLRSKYERNRKISIYDSLYDIERRINGLKVFKSVLDEGQFSNLILIVPEFSSEEKRDPSFTITTHMYVNLLPGEGKDPHNGLFYYSPNKKNSFLRRTWIKKFKMAKEYGSTRKDWPNDLIDMTNVDLYKEQIRDYNIESVEKVISTLDKLRDSLKTQIKNKKDFFLCHASEDKNAIVRTFDQVCKENNIKTFFDEAEISLGDDIRYKISYGLNNSKLFLIFISEITLKKYEVLKELSMAIDKDGVIIPILLGISEKDLMFFETDLPKNYRSLSDMRHIKIDLYDPNIAINKNEVSEIIYNLKNELEEIDK